MTNLSIPTAKSDFFHMLANYWNFSIVFSKKKLTGNYNNKQDIDKR